MLDGIILRSLGKKSPKLQYYNGNKDSEEHVEHVDNCMDHYHY